MKTVKRSAKPQLIFAKVPYVHCRVILKECKMIGSQWTTDVD